MKSLVALLVLFSSVPLAPVVFAQDRGTFDRAKAEREVMAVLDDFMASFNRIDAAAHLRTYQFPHYRLASGRMTVVQELNPETEAQWTERMRALQAAGWDHSQWIRRRVVHMSESKAHVDTEFARYRKDGSLIGKYESLYVVTRENGRWGVKLRSSFAE